MSHSGLVRFDQKMRTQATKRIPKRNKKIKAKEEQKKVTTLLPHFLRAYSTPYSLLCWYEMIKSLGDVRLKR